MSGGVLLFFVLFFVFAVFGFDFDFVLASPLPFLEVGKAT